MELKDALFVIAALVTGLVVGMAIAPEYIFLEDIERDSYEARIVSIRESYDKTIIEWEEYSEEIVQYEKDQCVADKRETVDRLSSGNRKLIENNKEMNEKWQEVIQDINTTISIGFNNLNTTICDSNCC